MREFVENSEAEMFIAYSDRGIRKLCESRATANKVLGSEAATRLTNRLADLDAATSVDDLGQFGLVKLNGSKEGHFKIEITERHKLLLIANDHNLPLTENGEVDWKNVFRVKILKLEENES